MCKVLCFTTYKKYKKVIAVSSTQQQMLANAQQVHNKAVQQHTSAVLRKLASANLTRIYNK